MSLIIIFFILVPALAPSIGQGILLFYSWRGIFIFIFVMGVVCLIWFVLGQPETLDKSKRRKFSFLIIFDGVKETLKNKFTRGYTIDSGLVIGSFIGYLCSSQQILQGQ